MSPTLGDRLAHILEAIDNIEKFLAGRSRQDFAADPVLRLAIERPFEIISEASRYIPEDMKTGETKIAWKRMADLGNWLRHAYHRIDAGLLWNMATNDLEPLKLFVKRIVQSNRAN